MNTPPEFFSELNCLRRSAPSTPTRPTDAPPAALLPSGKSRLIKRCEPPRQVCRLWILIAVTWGHGRTKAASRSVAPRIEALGSVSAPRQRAAPGVPGPLLVVFGESAPIPLSRLNSSILPVYVPLDK